MRKLLLAFTVAAAGVGVVRAQDVKSTTTTKAEHAQLVTYTGCLTSTAGSDSFFLENAFPVKEGKTEIKVERNGDQIKTTTSGKYVLVPGGQVDFQKEVGRKVEITAILIPPGDHDTKIETKTETKVKGQPDQKVETTEKIAQTSTTQLRVMSVKHLSDRCQP